jgi:hypothetical protein
MSTSPQRIEMSLAEAYRRRDEIKQIGKGIYFRSDTAQTSYPLDFVEQSRRKPNWYVVMLQRTDDYSSAFSLPGDVIVLVE